MIFTNEFFSSTSTIADTAKIELVDEFTYETHIYEQIAPVSNPDGIVRRNRNGVYYLNKTVSESSEPLDVGIFGAKGNGSTDDTESINKAVLYLSKIGRGSLKFSSNKNYLINGTIYITSNINFYCNGATFVGNSNGSNTIIETAYLTTENNVTFLKSNLLEDYQSHVVVSSQIRDANFVRCGTGIHFVNFCTGCSLENIIFSNCVCSIKFDHCFYTTLKNIISTPVFRESTTPHEYSYQFLGQNNALLLERMTATRELGFLFEGGTTATSIISSTTEGGQTGFKFKDECLGVVIKGPYAEGIFNAIDLSEVPVGTFEITGGYFTYVDKPLIGPGNLAGPNESANYGQVTGEWNNNTVIPDRQLPIYDNHNNVIGYNNYRGLMDISQPRNYINYSLPIIEGDGSLPSNWIVGDHNIISSYGQIKATDIKAIGNVKRQFGVIPVTRSGDVGDGKAGFIPDCTHELIGSNPSDFGIKIKTKIKFQEYMMFAKYNIYVATYSLGRWFYGDIFGKNLSAKDVGNSQVTSIENENGFLVIKITGFNEPNLGYIIQGNVQLIV